MVRCRAAQFSKPHQTLTMTACNSSHTTIIIRLVFEHVRGGQQNLDRITEHPRCLHLTMRTTPAQSFSTTFLMVLPQVTKDLIVRTLSSSLLAFCSTTSCHALCRNLGRLRNFSSTLVRQRRKSRDQIDSLCDLVTHIVSKDCSSVRTIYGLILTKTCYAVPKPRIQVLTMRKSCRSN